MHARAVRVLRAAVNADIVVTSGRPLVAPCALLPVFSYCILGQVMLMCMCININIGAIFERNVNNAKIVLKIQIQARSVFMLPINMDYESLLRSENICLQKGRIHNEEQDGESSLMKKRRVKYWVLAIVVVIIAAIAALAYWQKNNITALYMAVSSDEESIQKKEEDLQNRREELFANLGLNPSGTQTGSGDTEEPTDEAAVQSPTVTPTGSGSVEDTPPPTQTPAAENSSEPSSEPEEESESESAESSNAIIEESVAKLFELENSYMEQLDQIVADTKAEFAALPREEKTAANKKRLIEEKVSLLSSMEKECDAKVEELLSVISDELKKQGQPEDTVDEIRDIYEDTKATWKAKCLTELQKSNRD